jgi:predicted aldo/keto reductase-like oxidoreductase
VSTCLVENVVLQKIVINGKLSVINPLPSFFLIHNRKMIREMKRERERERKKEKERVIFGFGPKINIIKNNTQRLSILENAYNKGFRTFETAPIYGFGLSERLLGEFIKKKNIKIITKFGIKSLSMPKNFDNIPFLVKNFERLNNRLFYPNIIDYELNNMIRSIQNSIKRLGQTPCYYLFHGINRNLTNQEYLNFKNKSLYLKRNIGINCTGIASASFHDDKIFDRNFDIIQTSIETYYKFIKQKYKNNFILYGIFNYYKNQKTNLDFNSFVKKLLKDLPNNCSLILSSTNINTIKKWNFFDN